MDPNNFSRQKKTSNEKAYKRRRSQLHMIFFCRKRCLFVWAVRMPLIKSDNSPGDPSLDAIDNPRINNIWLQAQIPNWIIENMDFWIFGWFRMWIKKKWGGKYVAHRFSIERQLHLFETHVKADVLLRHPCLWWWVFNWKGYIFIINVFESFDFHCWFLREFGRKLMCWEWR